MDPDRPARNPRRKNRSRTPSDFKFDTFGLSLEDPASKFEEFKSSSTLDGGGNKKVSPIVGGDLKHWSMVTEGFPPGTTVDELKKYGRRRQPSNMRPRDNLHLEEGSLKLCESEYKRRFQAPEQLDFGETSEKALANKENSSHDELFYFLPEYRFSYVDYPRKRPVLKRPPNNLEPLKDYQTDYSTEKSSQYVLHPNCERRKLLRRSTTLKPEGEMADGETEAQDEYKFYPNPERAGMIRRLTSLKLDGNFGPFATEQQDSFIAFPLRKRPILEKKSTLLKMEGDFDFLTEKTLKYVAHDLPERPRIRKRSTSLKLIGELEFFPEYRESFVDFRRTRPITRRPNENLRNVGELENRTETKAQFVNFENVRIPESAKPENNLHLEGEMEISPEYKVNFVNFPRERPLLRRPPDRIKPEGNLQVLKENSKKFFPELPPIEKSKSLEPSEDGSKPVETFDFTNGQSDAFKNPEKLEKMESVKVAAKPEEKAEENGFSPGEKEKVGRRPSSLKMDGEFSLFPKREKSLEKFSGSGSLPKAVRNFRSNPASPRKKPREKINFNLDENVISVPEMAIRRSPSIRRLNEPRRNAEKNLKFDLPPKTRSGRVEARGDSLVAKPPGGDTCLPPAKQFQAFHVLDVKGKLGCQTMRKDILESDPDELNSTYRLEVSGSEKPDCLHRGDWKVFPTPDVDAEIREEAEKRARKRAETYEKIVKSPKVANYLLEENGRSNSDCRMDPGTCWKTSGKLSPLLPPDNLNKRAFVVLANPRAVDQQAKESVKVEKTD